MSRDTFTTTVDGAAAFERWHSDEGYDDRPSVSELAESAALPPAPVPADDPWGRAYDAEVARRQAANAGSGGSSYDPF